MYLFYEITGIDNISNDYNYVLLSVEKEHEDAHCVLLNCLLPSTGIARNFQLNVMTNIYIYEK